MKNFIWDKLYVGMLAGILPPIIAFLTYYFLNYSYMSRGEFFRFLARGEMYTQIVTLCVLLNLVPFYLFINKEKYNATKGVLASTFIWAGVVLFLKFYIEP
jgi:hypothetical protein